MNPSISVIIPTYNVSSYINNTLTGLINQSFSDFELLVIDDGSTDETVFLTEKILRNSKINYKIIRQKHGGVGKARNRGLRESLGEYIYFIDADDKIDSDCLRIMYTNAISNNADLIFCNFNYINNGKLEKSKFNRNMSFKGNNNLYIKKLLKNNIKICIGSIMIKRRLIEDNKIRFVEGYKNYEDQDFIVKVLFHSKKIKALPEKLLYYTLRKDSASQQFLNKVNYVPIYNMLGQYLTNKEANKEIVDYIYKYKIPTTYLSIISSLIKNKYPRQHIIDLCNDQNIKSQITKFEFMEYDFNEIKTWFKIQLYLMYPYIYDKILSRKWRCFFDE